MTLSGASLPSESDQPASQLPAFDRALAPYPVEYPTGDEEPFTLNQLADTPPAMTPSSRSRRGLSIVLVAVLALAVVVGGAGYAFRGWLFKDSGVAACEAMRDAKAHDTAIPVTAKSSGGNLSVDQHHEIRK